jgi:hypothetical protein
MEAKTDVCKSHKNNTNLVVVAMPLNICRHDQNNTQIILDFAFTEVLRV